MEKTKNPDDYSHFYDANNEYQLPGKKEKKQKSKVTAVPAKKKKPLTKKQKKRLETLVSCKEKKAKRKDLLEKLAEVQATKEQLHQLISTSAMQTKGLKRHFIETKIPIDNDKPVKINSIKKSKNAKRRKIVEITKQESTEDEETSSSDESSEDDIEIVPEKKPDEINEQEKMEEKVVESEKVDVREITVENKLEIVKTPAVFVSVNRTQEMQDSRMKLPILAEEQMIMESINENPVVVLCGETGSGKTTQIPQFLYEAGYATTKMIAVTEPRRVAAISMSKRIAEEMNLTNDEISYQIRYEGNVGEKTKIKFMTDGVLLKEIQKDFLLLNYSVVIIDEAHERSVYTDVLIGLLSRIVPMRYKKGDPLKLIIMSATLRVEDFTENMRLFKVKPPAIKVDSRQFQVNVYFNKRTPDDYLSEAYRKVCKIHRQLPDGGILVFVTGRQEVNILCHKLSRTFPSKRKKNNDNVEDNIEDVDSIKKMAKLKRAGTRKKPCLPQINLDDFTEVPVDISAHVNNDEPSDCEDSDDEFEDFSVELFDEDSQPLHVLPLFSLLPSSKQSKIFKPPPPGSRLCVIATNVAETSITIPNVKYVVDTGKVKSRFYDKMTGVSTFMVTWTSKAAANQRAGRAGRTGPGYCYRLYSSAVFTDEFELFSQPEICRKPIDGLVLQMKDMNIDRVVNFPFPSAPDPAALKAAEKRLCLLGALDETPKNLRLKDKIKFDWCNKVTKLGHTMACFPVAPCYAKMIALGDQHDLLPYIVCIVAALTVQELLLDSPTTNDTQDKSIRTEEKKTWREKRLKWAGQGHSLLLGDAMVLLKTVGAAEFADCSLEFCMRHGIRHKAIVEVRKLRTQLTNAINLVMPNVDLCVDPKMKHPEDFKIKLLRQIVLAGVPNHVARKIAECEIKEGEDRRRYKKAYECSEVDGLVFIDVNSVLHRAQPEYVVYQEMLETNKLYLRGVTAIEPEWLALCAPSLCNFSKPLDDPKPRYDEEKDQIYCHVTGTFGSRCWPLPPAEIKFPKNADRFRWFALFLLDGQVCAPLKHFTSVLLSSPITMVKSWAKLQPRTESLLKCLLAKNVDSKQTLIARWKDDDKYLLQQYLEWLPAALHNEVKTIWPPA
uniref:RNA helicase n=1 Tax=Strigamia maritima TaxID=126957 RepID=T1J6J7_STRMM